MNPVEKELKIYEQTFLLTNLRGLVWVEKKTIIISDLHLGKTAHFRKHGIALPSTIIFEDLKRLAYLINYYQTDKLIIVGDFIHAGKNTEFEIFVKWKSQFKNLEITLIKGNHDKINLHELGKIGVSNFFDFLKIDEIYMSHEFVNTNNEFIISGHIHPGVRINLPTNKNFKLPCYALSKTNLILPAFSKFTGLDTSISNLNYHFYAFTDNEIFCVKI